MAGDATTTTTVTAITSNERTELWRSALSITPTCIESARCSYQTAVTSIDTELFASIKPIVARACVWRAPGDDGRSRRAPPLIPPPTQIVDSLTRVLCVYVTTSSVSFHKDMVYVAAPFLEVFHNVEWETERAFSSLMSTHAQLFDSNNAQMRVAEFTTALMHLYPELFDYLDAECVDMNKWALSWLRTLLARQMPRASVLRLWDEYVTESDVSSMLHPYVCLVLVGSISSELQDCDDGEGLEHYLYKPNIVARDPIRIVQHAIKVRAALKASGVI